MLEEAHCDGCRSERRTPYCQACTLFACAEQRGHTFCQECDEYPCPALEEFRRARPHRIEIYDNLDRIADVGAQAWLDEARDRHRCPVCGTINSAYDLTCRTCGHDPGSAYAAAHHQAIVERLRQLEP